jgi:hypothetical protein
LTPPSTPADKQTITLPPNKLTFGAILAAVGDDSDTESAPAFPHLSSASRTGNDKTRVFRLNPAKTDDAAVPRPESPHLCSAQLPRICTKRPNFSRKASPSLPLDA